jgi:hypothetical protein
MGYFRHHAIVVTSWNEAHIRRAHHEAEQRFQDTAAWVSPLSETGVNGYHSFFVAPDGSKEWWPESDQGDKTRAAFLDWLRDDDGYYSYAEIQFGDEGGDDRLLRSSASDPEEESAP